MLTLYVYFYRLYHSGVRFCFIIGCQIVGITHILSSWRPANGHKRKIGSILSKRAPRVVLYPEYFNITCLIGITDDQYILSFYHVVNL